MEANTCTSTTRSIEREFCLSLDCTVSMKFIAFSDSGTAEHFSGSERGKTVSLYFFSENVVHSSPVRPHKNTKGNSQKIGN